MLINFNEEIFKRIDSFLLDFFYRRQQQHSNFKITHTVYLNNYSIRLSNFATFLYKKCIIVQESSSLYGFYGNKLFLPSQINISSYCEINFLFYLYQIIFFVQINNFGFHYNTILKDSKKIILFNILLIIYIQKKISKLYKEFSSLLKYFYSIFFIELKNLKNLFGFTLFLDFSLRLSFFFPFFTNSFPNSFLFLNKYFGDIYFIIFNSKILTKYEFLKILNFLYEKIDNLYKKDKNFFYFNNFFINMFCFEQHFFFKLHNKFNSYFFSNLLKKSKFTEKKKLDKTVVADVVEYKKSKYGDFPILMLFQGVQTIETYDGGLREYNSKDELAQHYDALKDVNLKNVIRSDTTSASIYHSFVDILSHFFISNKKDINIKNEYYYDEWDFYQKKYKKSWCRVFVSFVDNINLTQVEFDNKLNKILFKLRFLIFFLQKKIQFIFNQDMWLKRQLDGPSIDIDSFVNIYPSIMLKKPLDERLYLIKRKKMQSVVFSILLDSSLSTDSIFYENYRIIDFLQNICLILGEIFNNVGITFSLFYFFSNTHANCSFVKLKDFYTNWNTARINVLNVIPQGYTRVGPALRHCVTELKKIKCRTKILILLSDSKPTDYDFYEGFYGIEDVRQVVQEILSNNIKFKNFSVFDKSTLTYLSKMYGKSNFYYAVDMDSLKKQLTKLLLSCFNKKYF